MCWREATLAVLPRAWWMASEEGGAACRDMFAVPRSDEAMSFETQAGSAGRVARWLQRSRLGTRAARYDTPGLASRARKPPTPLPAPARPCHWC